MTSASLIQARTALTTPALVTRSLPPLALVDQWIFQSDDAFNRPEPERHAALVAMVREQLTRQVQANPSVARYFRRRGFDPASLAHYRDLERIPVIPTDVFKRIELCSVPRQTIARSFTSSGTSGRVSRVLRDDATLERMIGSVSACLGFLSPWLDRFTLDERSMIVNLGPSREEAGEVWFAYVMALVEILAPTRHFMRGGTLLLAEALAAIEAGLREAKQVVVVGAPALVLSLVERIEARERPVDGGAHMVIITAGGWKAQAAREIARPEFRQRVANAFQLEGTTQVRDVFNQVELNSVCMECEFHRKHVPPWVFCSARDPVGLGATPAGTLGLLAYVDASASSYPCCIVGDDLGSVSEGGCECGRSGQTLTIERRIERSADAGCALKLDAMQASRARPPVNLHTDELP